MKVIIAGSRTFGNMMARPQSYRDDIRQAFEVLDSYNEIYTFTVVVSGNANGADRVGEMWAAATGLPIDPHPANWDKYGKRAGFIRNAEMEKVADMAIVFWDGKSRGTANMIELMNKAGKVVFVKNFKAAI